MKWRPHRELDVLSCVRDISATLTAGRPSYGTDVDPLGGLRQLERLVQKHWWLRRRGYQAQLRGQWRRWVIVIEGGHGPQAHPPTGKRPTDDGTPPRLSIIPKGGPESKDSLRSYMRWLRLRSQRSCSLRRSQSVPRGPAEERGQ
jgi:hypothetical protein